MALKFCQKLVALYFCIHVLRINYSISINVIVHYFFLQAALIKILKFIVSCVCNLGSGLQEQLQKISLELVQKEDEVYNIQF